MELFNFFFFVHLNLCLWCLIRCFANTTTAQSATKRHRRHIFQVKGKERSHDRLNDHEEKIDYNTVHIIFSTDCMPYQDWQSLVLFHSAQRVGHRGSITRIACGCNQKKQTELILLYNQLFSKLPFKIFFAPNFSIDAKKREYVYYNKSWGLRYFLFHQTNNSDIKSEFPFLSDPNAIIADIDPDFIFLRPLTGVVNAFDALPTYPNYVSLPDKVLPGHPIGQTYGHGVPWTVDRPWSEQDNFHRVEVCGKGSPCLQVSTDHGMRHYTVGSPYIAVLSDMKNLAVTWSDFAIKLFEYQATHQSEMHAYSMAAAHLHLPHSQYNHFMISNPRMEEEGWAWIDTMTEDELCQDSSMSIGKPLPIFLHYCQHYGLRDIMLSKYTILPRDVLSCPKDINENHTRKYDKPPLWLPTLLEVDIVNLVKTNNITHYLFPQQSYVGGSKHGKKFDVVPINNEKEKKRLAFVLCTLQRNIRDTIEEYRKVAC